MFLKLSIFWSFNKLKRAFQPLSSVSHKLLRPVRYPSARKNSPCVLNKLVSFRPFKHQGEFWRLFQPFEPFLFIWEKERGWIIRSMEDDILEIIKISEPLCFGQDRVGILVNQSLPRSWLIIFEAANFESTIWSFLGTWFVRWLDFLLRRKSIVSHQLSQEREIRRHGQANTERIYGGRLTQIRRFHPPPLACEIYDLQPWRWPRKSVRSAAGWPI